MAYGTATLTGTYKTFDDQPAEGVVEIIPNSRQLIDAEGDVVLAGRVKVTLDAAGSFTVTLPATDDATVEPATGRQYTVVAKLRHTHLPAATGVELATGATVDIADVSAQPETDAAVSNAATTAQLAALEAEVDANTTAIAGKADAASLATVATTGAYTDLSGTPTIPTTPGEVGAEPAGLSAATQDALSASYAGKAIEILDDLGNVSGVVSIDPANGGTQTLTLTGDATLSPVEATPGATVTLVITQGTGAPHTATWPRQVKFQTEPVLSTAENLIDVVTLVNVNGYGWLGFVSGTGLRAPVEGITDSFNRADSATLGTADTGETWTSTNWTISSNAAVPTSSALATRAILDTGLSENIKVSCRPMSTALAIRLECRAAADDSTYYRLVWSSLTAANSFIQRNNGSGFATVGTTFGLGAVVGDRIGYSVTMTAGVATITVYRNDTVIYTTTDSAPPPAATYAGMIAVGGGLGPVEDFQVDFL